MEHVVSVLNQRLEDAQEQVERTNRDRQKEVRDVEVRHFAVMDERSRAWVSERESLESRLNISETRINLLLSQIKEYEDIIDRVKRPDGKVVTFAEMEGKKEEIAMDFELKKAAMRRHMRKLEGEIHAQKARYEEVVVQAGDLRQGMNRLGRELSSERMTLLRLKDELVGERATAKENFDKFFTSEATVKQLQKQLKREREVAEEHRKYSQMTIDDMASNIEAMVEDRKVQLQEMREMGDKLVEKCQASKVADIKAVTERLEARNEAVKEQYSQRLGMLETTYHDVTEKLEMSQNKHEELGEELKKGEHREMLLDTRNQYLDKRLAEREDYYFKDRESWLWEKEHLKDENGKLREWNKKLRGELLEERGRIAEHMAAIVKDDGSVVEDAQDSDEDAGADDELADSTEQTQISTNQNGDEIASDLAALDARIYSAQSQIAWNMKSPLEKAFPASTLEKICELKQQLRCLDRRSDELTRRINQQKMGKKNWGIMTLSKQLLRLASAIVPVEHELARLWEEIDYIREPWEALSSGPIATQQHQKSNAEVPWMPEATEWFLPRCGSEDEQTVSVSADPKLYRLNCVPLQDIICEVDGKSSLTQLERLSVIKNLDVLIVALVKSWNIIFASTHMQLDQTPIYWRYVDMKVQLEHDLKKSLDCCLKDRNTRHYTFKVLKVWKRHILGRRRLDDWGYNNVVREALTGYREERHPDTKSSSSSIIPTPTLSTTAKLPTFPELVQGVELARCALYMNMSTRTTTCEELLPLVKSNIQELSHFMSKFRHRKALPPVQACSACKEIEILGRTASHISGPQDGDSLSSGPALDEGLKTMQNRLRQGVDEVESKFKVEISAKAASPSEPDKPMSNDLEWCEREQPCQIESGGRVAEILDEIAGDTQKSQFNYPQNRVSPEQKKPEAETKTSSTSGPSLQLESDASLPFKGRKILKVRTTRPRVSPAPVPPQVSEIGGLAALILSAGDMQGPGLLPKQPPHQQATTNAEAEVSGSMSGTTSTSAPIPIPAPKNAANARVEIDSDGITAESEISITQKERIAAILRDTSSYLNKNIRFADHPTSPSLPAPGVDHKSADASVLENTLQDPCSEDYDEMPELEPSEICNSDMPRCSWIGFRPASSPCPEDLASTSGTAVPEKREAVTEAELLDQIKSTLDIDVTMWEGSGEEEETGEDDEAATASTMPGEYPAHSWSRTDSPTLGRVEREDFAVDSESWKKIEAAEEW
jgi:hypothetical protein